MTAPARPAPLQTIHVGDVDVTYLPDGEGHFVPTQFFPGSDAAAWQNHREWLDEAGRTVTTLGAFLIRSAGRTVIVDLGIGAAEMDIPDFAWLRSGALLDSLSRAGVTPADVDTVLYTHLHSDHTGWTSGSDGLTFPHAEHLVGAHEFEFWRANSEMDFAPPVEGVLDPLAHRITVTEDGHTVAPGVTVRSTPGHTPGHQTVVVSSGEQRAVILGDVMHCPAQLTERDWSVLFDVDAAMARRTREKLLDELEDADVAVGCGHFPEAAFGRVMTGQGRRYWSPNP